MEHQITYCYVVTENNRMKLCCLSQITTVALQLFVMALRLALRLVFQKRFQIEKDWKFDERLQNLKKSSFGFVSLPKINNTYCKLAPQVDESESKIGSKIEKKFDTSFQSIWDARFINFEHQNMIKLK